MSKINITSPRNTMAISAMLMLSVGSAYAQEVTVPVTVEPPVAGAPVVAPAPSAPTIVIPTPTAEPVVQPSPTPLAMQTGQTVATPPARARATASPTTRAPTREVAQTAPVAPVTASATSQAAEPAAPPAAVPDEAAAASAPDTTAITNEGSTDWAIPVGAAATLLVLGGVGLALSRRRRPYEEDVDFVPPVATRPAFRPQPERRVAPPVAPERLTAPDFAMAPPLRSDAEREALIERITAAAPDEANPFTSRKARRRRARIMVQSMTARNEVPTNTLGPAPSENARVERMPEHAHV